MGIATIVRRVRTLIARIAGVGVVLLGLLVVLFSVPPTDVETGALFGIGAVVVLLGIGIVRNPEKVRFGRRRRYEDDPDHGATGARRRNRKLR